MPEELASDTGFDSPLVEDVAPPAAEVVAAPVVPEPVKPAEDVEGIKGALVAERRRRQELEAEITTLRTPPPAPKSDIPDVSDDQAEKFAKRYELYTTTGLDLARAKQMIADNRKEMADVARQAAEAAIEPLRQTTANQASKNNFVWAASQVDADGKPLVDANELAAVWSTFPAELAANPEVAKVILKATLGEKMMTQQPRKYPRPPEREPLLSEPSGGNRAGAYTMSNIEKKVAGAAGIASDKWEAAAKTYRPGQPNTLE